MAYVKQINAESLEGLYHYCDALKKPFTRIDIGEDDIKQTLYDAFYTEVIHFENALAILKSIFWRSEEDDTNCQKACDIILDNCNVKLCYIAEIDGEKHVYFFSHYLGKSVCYQCIIY